MLGFFFLRRMDMDCMGIMSRDTGPDGMPCLSLLDGVIQQHDHTVPAVIDTDNYEQQKKCFVFLCRFQNTDIP